jgi:hypothetical protein
MRQRPLPSIRAIDDAPERCVLSVLDVCATNAEQILLSRNPDTLEFLALMRDELPGPSPPLMIASRQLIRSIYKLRDAIALYEAALSASLHPEHDDNPLDDALF